MSQSTRCHCSISTRNHLRGTSQRQHQSMSIQYSSLAFLRRRALSVFVFARFEPDCDSNASPDRPERVLQLNSRHSLAVLLTLLLGQSEAQVTIGMSTNCSIDTPRTTRKQWYDWRSLPSTVADRSLGPHHDSISIKLKLCTWMAWQPEMLSEASRELSSPRHSLLGHHLVAAATL